MGPAEPSRVAPKIFWISVVAGIEFAIDHFYFSSRERSIQDHQVMSCMHSLRLLVLAPLSLMATAVYAQESDVAVAEAIEAVSDVPVAQATELAKGTPDRSLRPLTVTIGFLVTFSALFLENCNGISFQVPENFGCHLGAFHEGLAHTDLSIIIE